MFRHRQRTAPLSESINWTDYRWDSSAPTHAPGQPRVSGSPASPRQEFNVLQLFLAGLAVIVGLTLMSGLRHRRNRSRWQRGVLAAVLVMVASYVAKRRTRL